MPAAEYHRDPAPAPSLSASIAHLLCTQAPVHAWTSHPRLNPNFVEEEDEKFDLGTAAHSLFLEGENNMIEVTFDDWRTKAAKAARDEIRSQDKLPILSKYYGRTLKMVGIAAQALFEAEDLRLTVADCYAERTVIWSDPSGVHLRARPDLWAKHKSLLIDYKTVDNADPRIFARQAINLGYDIQAALQVMAWRVAKIDAEGRQDVLMVDPGYCWLVQERKEPFACSVVGIDATMLELGMSKLAYARGLWRDCIRSGFWPGYPLKTYWAETPPWALAAWEERRTGEAPE